MAVRPDCVSPRMLHLTCESIRRGRAYLLYIRSLLLSCCRYVHYLDEPGFETDIKMPTHRFDSWDDGSRRGRRGRRTSKHDRSRTHPNPPMSDLTQETDDMYGPPWETNTYSPQMALADRRLTLSPLSQSIEDRRAHRARNPRSASSPVRQKYVYPAQEASSISSTGRTEDSASLLTSARSSRYDAERHGTTRDADSRTRSRTQREKEKRTAPIHEPAGRKLTPPYPPSSYPTSRHKRSHKKSEPYPSSTPSSVGAQDFAPDLKYPSWTKRGSYRESIEDLKTLSQSEYAQTDVTETMTDLSHTEGNTEYATSHTGSTTGRDHFHREESRSPTEYGYLTEHSIDPQVGRNMRQDPEHCGQTEAVVSAATNRSSTLLYTDHQLFQERFKDLLYICPKNFWPKLLTWEDYEVLGRKNFTKVTLSDWYYAQRKAVMRHVQVLDEFYEDHLRPIRQSRSV